jgi:D-alanyl-D-alanine dipeptidase
MKNKILRKGLFRLISAFIFLFHSHNIIAQNLPVSSYGLSYINNIPLFKESLLHHPEKQMFSLKNVSGIMMDLRYASENNFMHKKLYPGIIKTTYLRKPVYEALDSVSMFLATLGFQLVIFDAYRPYSVTESLWEKVKDDRYAANPSKGSGHNRGIAVDLTMSDLITHKLVVMPTNFDNFSDSAHQDFKNANAEAISNREILTNAMEKFGFEPLPTEWWHFSWPHSENFEVLDLSFDQLDKLNPVGK